MGKLRGNRDLNQLEIHYKLLVTYYTWCLALDVLLKYVPNYIYYIFFA